MLSSRFLRYHIDTGVGLVARVFLILVLMGNTSLLSAKTVAQGGAVVQYPEIRAELVAYAPRGLALTSRLVWACYSTISRDGTRIG